MAKRERAQPEGEGPPEGGARRLNNLSVASPSRRRATVGDPKLSGAREPAASRDPRRVSSRLCPAVMPPSRAPVRPSPAPLSGHTLATGEGRSRLEGGSATVAGTEKERKKRKKEKEKEMEKERKRRKKGKKRKKERKREIRKKFFRSQSYEKLSTRGR